MYIEAYWLPFSQNNSVSQGRYHSNNSAQEGLITIITWNFQFHLVNVSNLHVKSAYVLEARAISRAPLIVTSRDAP